MSGLSRELVVQTPSHDCYRQAVLGDAQAENLECSQTHIPDTQPQIWAPGNWPGCQKCFSSNVTTVGKKGEGESPSQLPGLKKKKKRKKKPCKKKGNRVRKSLGRLTHQRLAKDASDEHLFIAVS